MNKEIKFICAQPAINYYTWQVEVMINNFIENGIKSKNINIISWKVNNIVPENWYLLMNYYKNVNFYFYSDTRKTKYYKSSIRPNILKQHWIEHPELKNNIIFYHDNDIVFTRPINWEIFSNDNKWYGSDTRWYISHDYIISKGEDILNKMCRIVNIDKNIVKENELNSIGAQYIMKNITWEFWEKVEQDSEKLYKEISVINDMKKFKDPNYHPIQIWCADMWALLWNAWKLGHETVCHSDLDFSWGTSNEDNWYKYNIFHNAGVTTDNNGLFYKALFMDKLPYNVDLYIKSNTASWHYWNIIQSVAKKSCLIDSQKINF